MRDDVGGAGNPGSEATTSQFDMVGAREARVRMLHKLQGARLLLLRRNEKHLFASTLRGSRRRGS